MRSDLRRSGWLVVLVCVALVSACAQDGALERADLVRDPAAALRMPGADDLGHVGRDRMRTLDGEQQAFEGHIFGTAASSAEVIAFYTGELARLGWTPHGNAGLSTVELDLRWWCTPKAGFRLGIEDKARAFQPAFYKGKDYVTVFDARLVAYSATAACSSPSPTR